MSINSSLLKRKSKFEKSGRLEQYLQRKDGL
jgi:hypothetical protein